MCPENSHSEVLGSRHASDCTCNVGYTLSHDGKQCKACTAGTYKTANGSMGCALCSYGTYSMTEGATSVSTCVSCPLLYFSQRGSSSPSNCSATEVFTAVSAAISVSDSQTNSTCLSSRSDVLGACKTHQDCGGEGRGECHNGTCVCGGLFGGVTCSACRPGFEGVNCSLACDCHGHGICTSSGACKCGGWWRGSECMDRLCPRGWGGALCGSECLTCSGNGLCSVSGECVCDSDWGGRKCSVLECGSGTICSCGKGHTFIEGGGCVACAAGSFKDVNGLTQCMLCPSGKYSTASGAISQSTCSDCPAYSYSSAGSPLLNNCTCNKGYTGM